MTTDSVPAQIELLPVDPHDLGVMLDNRTVLLRYADSELGPHTTVQAWRWDGGDAIGVQMYAKLWWVIRDGDTLRTIQAGSVKSAMTKVGIDPFRFRVAAPFKAA